MLLEPFPVVFSHEKEGHRKEAYIRSIGFTKNFTKLQLKFKNKKKNIKHVYETLATKVFMRKESEANIEKFGYCVYHVCIGRQKHVDQVMCWKEGLRKYLR